MNLLSIILLATSLALVALIIYLQKQLKNCNKSHEELDSIQDMISAFPQSMFLLDKNKVIIGIYNIMPEAMAGYSKEDIIGKHISVFVDDPESPFHQACSMLNSSFDEVKRTGKTVQFEYMIEQAYLEATISQISQGRVLSQVRDISSIVQNRQEVEKRSRNHLSVALAAGGMLSWHYDVPNDSFSFLDKSDNDFDLNGTKLEDAISFISPKYRKKVQELFKSLIEKRVELFETVIQAFDSNNKTIWLQCYAVPYEYAHDGSILQIVGFQKDITKQKEDKFEILLNRKKLEFAIQAAGLQQWEYNIKEDSFVSEQSTLAKGEKLRFKEVRNLIHPSDHFLFDQEIAKITNQQTDSIHIQMRVLRQEGHYEWFSLNAALFTHDEETGAPLIAIGLMNNINDSVRMTNELIELRDKAEESNRLKSSFLANMSHEIRTPLNAIVGFSNLIGHTEDKEEMAEYLRIIENNNELLLTLIDDILDLSRIETGKIRFAYTPISINLLLAQLQQSTQLRVKRGVEVILEDLEEDLVIVSDTARLTQIISNFLNNAAKFTSQGSITLGCKRVETGFRFHVTDTGIGISEKSLPTIFNRFVKLDPNAQGTGLGLSICSMIVQLLGGLIGADSEEGKGSTFWCILPSAQTYLSSSEVRHPSPHYSRDNLSFSDITAQKTEKKILIAEDNRNNFDLYKKVLSEYNIIHALNGAQAIEYFHKETPDLIIMDLSMPMMNGFKATSIIREHATDIPIIAVSASVLPEERTMALSNGFTDFIAKPIDVISFKRMVNYYL